MSCMEYTATCNNHNGVYSTLHVHILYNDAGYLFVYNAHAILKPAYFWLHLIMILQSNTVLLCTTKAMYMYRVLGLMLQHFLTHRAMTTFKVQLKFMCQYTETHIKNGRIFKTRIYTTSVSLGKWSKGEGCHPPFWKNFGYLKVLNMQFRAKYWAIFKENQCKYLTLFTEGLNKGFLSLNWEDFPPSLF